MTPCKKYGTKVNAGRSPRSTPCSSVKYVGNQESKPYMPHDCVNWATHIARTSLLRMRARQTSKELCRSDVDATGPVNRAVSASSSSASSAPLLVGGETAGSRGTVSALSANQNG